MEDLAFTQPISRWCLKKLVVDTLSVSVRGVTRITRIITGISDFAHHLRDGPRKRRPQAPHSCPLFRTWTEMGLPEPA